ncbi:MAG: DNA-methyltransferase [Pseudobdellovibrionaceae bacterium]
MNFQTYLGDSLEILKKIPANSIDSLVTDPPAGIGLLGLEWDKNKGGRKEWIAWLTQIMTECHRILKPGAHGFVWAIPRTSHWTGAALEDAGFQVKDVITHIFGSGFPKNVAVDKAIDRAKYTSTDELFKVTGWIKSRRDELGLTNKKLDEIAGVKGGACHWTAMPPHGQPNVPTKERWEKLEAVLGPAPEWVFAMIKPANELGENWSKRTVVGQYKKDAGGIGGLAFKSVHNAMTEPISDLSKPWTGWGTALKPASEHWILIQKPISEHNIAANVLKHGVGGINIDQSRIPIHGKIPSATNLDFREGGFLWDAGTRSQSSVYHQHPSGRFPANVILTRSNDLDCPARVMNDQSEREVEVAQYFKNFKPEAPFLYCKKPGKDERDPLNNHPTVKPLRLMRYLCKMLTPPNGTVLDPFMGSGTTGVAALFEKYNFIGIERDENYHQIATKRLKGVRL